MILTSISTRAVRVPLSFTLGTSAVVVRAVPLLLIDLNTKEGFTGCSYVFCYTSSGARAIAAHVADIEQLLTGHPLTPMGAGQMLSRRLALLGVAGTVRMALSAVDIAIWDMLAKSLGLPLATMLGSEPRRIPAYDSRGLGLMPPEKLAEEASALHSKGMKALKLRLGYPTLAEDLAALHAVRRTLPPDIRVMVDYNQALTVAESIIRGRALQQEGITWIEEPIRHDDYPGNAAIARALDVPLQIGENLNGPEAMLAALAAEACDYVMPDVARIGGVSGWMSAAAIAAARNIEMSSHLMPEISAHLLSASPTGHWLEYVDWADAILQEPLAVSDGMVVTPDRPGLGLAWDEDKVKRLDPV
jgi:mandelate racemase